MPFNIRDFRSELRGQGARPNLFEVRVDSHFFGGQEADKFRFMCKGASIPGGDIGVAEVAYFGRNIKLPGNRVYAEWTTTVINDEDFLTHHGITSWMDKINQFEANDYVNRDSIDQRVPAEVDQYGKGGDIIHSVKMWNFWPSSISGIDLNWETNDSVEDFTVTWQYDYWEPANRAASA